MKTSRFLLLALFLASCFILAGPPLSAAEQAKTLSCNVWGGPNHWMTKTLQDWGKLLEKETQGKLKITMYPGGTLTTGAHAYSGLVTGISDLASACNGWTKGAFPVMRVVDLPIGLTNPVHGSLVTWDVYKKFQPKEWDEIKVLWMYNNGGQILSCIKPIRKFEDFKGLRIRTTGTDAEIVRLLGATPVAMDMGEAYLAHQKGIVDGLLAGVGALSSFKLAEVTKYHLVYPFTGQGFWVGMNKDVWKSLSPSLQKTLDGVGEQFLDIYYKHRTTEEKKGLELAKSRGNEFIKLPPNEEMKITNALSPLLNDYLSEMQKKGLPGKEVLDYSLSLVKKYYGRGE